MKQCFFYGSKEQKLYDTKVGFHMDFIKTRIDGVFLIKRNAIVDGRGYFGRLYCEREFFRNGLNDSFVQDNVCYNRNRYTLRGLHFQTEREEGKLVTCLRGSIWDVCVDIRRESSTFCKYVAYELSEANQNMLFIPKGCAHGYITLEENSVILYKMTEFYISGNEGGYRYDDPSFSIKWPCSLEDVVISEKDKCLPYIKVI